jgi:hypothetical protein
MAGGLTALLFYMLWRRKRKMKGEETRLKAKQKVVVQVEAKKKLTGMDRIYRIKKKL